MSSRLARFSEILRAAVAAVWRRPRLRMLILGMLILVIGLLLYPFQITVVPSWDAEVTDETSAAVREINVTEHWQHYLLEPSGHEEILKTGNDGSVSFPPRTIRASVLSRILHSIRKLPAAGVEARSDPYASIVIWGSRDYEIRVAVYRQGSEPVRKIVVQRRP